MAGSNRSFFLGAGAMLAGIVAGNLIRVSTLDNVRKLLFLADEAREVYKGERPKPIVVGGNDSYEDAPLEISNYDPLFDREAPPSPPPASYENFRPSAPVAISLDDDEDFLEKINEDASRGDSLIDDWTLA